MNDIASVDADLGVWLLEQEKCQLHYLVELRENIRINLVDFVHFLVELLLEYLHFLLFFLVHFGFHLVAKDFVLDFVHDLLNDFSPPLGCWKIRRYVRELQDLIASAHYVVVDALA